MSDNEVPTQQSRRGRRLGWGAGLLAAGALGGAVLAGTLPASAATPSAAPSTSGSSQAPGQAPAQGGAQGQRPGGPPGQRAGETVLTGNLAAQAKAAALKAVPGATIDRVETDADGATYEAHLTKSDGSKATVKFDKNFGLLAIQDGMGTTKQPPSTTGGA
jgi:hypothetical protein